MKPTTQQIRDIKGYIQMLKDIFPNSIIEPEVKKEDIYIYI